MRKILFSITILLIITSGLFGGEAFVDKFDKKNAWSPLAGVKSEIVFAEGRNCLHVYGKEEKGWNFVWSPFFKMEPGRKYRITGNILIKKLDPPLLPFFKIEFRDTDAQGKIIYTRDIGRISTTRRDPSKDGWQELTKEFICPDGAKGGNVALEKGVKDPVEIDGYISDIKVEEIDEFTRVKQMRFGPVPAPLEKMKKIHPRLYLNAEKIAELKRKIKEGPLAEIFKKVKAVADYGVRKGPPKYVIDDGHSGNEQLWQREVGNMIPHLALVYLLTEDKRYLKAASDLMLASASYPTWGYSDTDGKDLAAGHQLFGIALGYDWLYPYLDEETKSALRNCLLKRGQFMYDELYKEDVWWHQTYLQNHQWVNMAGLSAAGLALYGEKDNVDGWILLPLEKFKTTMRSLGPDGASHEGVPYWTYGLEYMLKFMDLAKDLLAEDLFKDNEWFKNTALFRLYAMLPQNSWKNGSTLMTFADGPRSDWYGPDYLLRKLAAEYKDGTAAWLGGALDKAEVCGRREGSFLNLLWYDPKVMPVQPDKLPLCKHFKDMDIVYSRSGWDGYENMYAFKCGPYIGHYALKMYNYDPGGGHVHPDAGSFQLFSFGDWLIVDDGYAFKETVYQNTALVNGIGQIGEGGAWFNGARLCMEKRGPSILRTESKNDYDYIKGDVTKAYKDEAGLKKYIRHFIYLKPSCWVVIDEFEAKKPSKFRLYFHGDHPFNKAGENSFTLSGKTGALCVTSFLPFKVNNEIMKQPVKGVSGKIEREMDALCLSNETDAERTIFVTVFEAYSASGKPQIKISSMGATPGLTLETPGKTFTIWIKNYDSGDLELTVE